jgi:hypothetical protein
MVEVAVFSLLLSAAILQLTKSSLVAVLVHIANQLRNKLAAFSKLVLSGTDSRLQLEMGS